VARPVALRREGEEVKDPDHSGWRKSYLRSVRIKRPAVRGKEAEQI
jgi:hypothetical protein